MPAANLIPPSKPNKPYPEFPLFPHATKRWAKKIRGKLVYFGPWDDPDAALNKYLAEKDALHAGRKPKEATGALTVKALANAFLNHKQGLLDAGELSKRTWATYKDATDLLVARLGKNRLVSDLSQDDFAALRKHMANRWGPVRLGGVIQRVRSVFKYGYDAELMATPIRFGPGFLRPSKKTLRLERAKQGPKMFEAAELHRILAAAGMPLKAMILLGVNCGFGNADCGTLPITALDLDRGFVNYHRPKTGITRRCPLWPETVEAIREAMEKRPGAKADDSLVFVTKQGGSWHKDATFSDNPQPTNPAAAVHFVRLHAHVQHLQPVYMHNHDRLWNHSRRAISRPYQSLCREMERLVGSLLEPARVAVESAKINAAMLDKQIAVDEYWNFRSDVELANTFIGLNTVRVELGPVDLIRAYIVDAATAQNWSPQDVARIENDITERFTRDGKTKPELVQTATVVLKCLQSRDGLSPNLIFPNWPAITPTEVDVLLDFVDRMLVRADRRTGINYLREIRECGYLPFALVMLFYYRQLVLHGTHPAFFGGPTPTAADADLHSLLRAAYRILLDGRVGRIGDIADKVARDAYATLPLVADDVAAMTSSGPLGNAPAPDWLRSCLTEVDRGKARRVFNACLLPDRIQSGGPCAPYGMLSVFRRGIGGGIRLLE